ncbi:hypothetical protein PHLH5_26060 [Pseudomonas sp. Cab53]|nr:hypothetical protein PHLH5_26060 [Pseudomonas sp. Cab53]
MPAASVKTTSRVWPLVCGLLSTTSNRPSVPTVPVPSRLPSASRMVSRLPASPRPLSVNPSLLSASPVGASGAVVSTVAPLPPPPPLATAPAAAAVPPTPSKPRPAKAQTGVAPSTTPAPAINSSSEETSSKVKPLNGSALYRACHRVLASPWKTISLVLPSVPLFLLGALDRVFLTRPLVGFTKMSFLYKNPQATLPHGGGGDYAIAKDRTGTVRTSLF